MIPKIDSTHFTWSKWRSGSIHDFRIPCRYVAITNEYNMMVLRTYAIGWCYGENLMCRPKANHIAVMFNVNENIFWFHLRKNEFIKVFGKE